MAPRRKHQSNRQQFTRQHIASEAARIMSTEGMNNFAFAKRKAADRLGVVNDRDWPSNAEVEQELRHYQRLFGGQDHTQTIETLRRQALDSMAFFARFKPRLVGPVLAGTAEKHSAVCLHLFADSPEQVRLFLLAQNIPHDEQPRRVRVRQEHYEDRPCMRFSAGDTPIDLTVFASHEIRQAPLSEVNGRPMERANLEQVALLLESDVAGT